jgi:hypothetical protein
MRALRNRAAWIAILVLTWNLGGMAAASVVLTGHLSGVSEHAGMENCPLHSKPACPLHGDRHGTHDCDCPTIGCSQPDLGMTALFGAIGVLPAASHMAVPFDAGDAIPVLASTSTSLGPVPLSPPPRA